MHIKTTFRLLAGIVLIGAAAAQGITPAQANSDPTDVDGDGFAATVELHVGTNPLLACGADAWPADVNNDGFSDVGDIGRLTNFFGERVAPEGPAPVRYDIAPDGFIDTGDIGTMTGHFGEQCQ